MALNDILGTGSRLRTVCNPRLVVSNIKDGRKYYVGYFTPTSYMKDA